MWLPRHVQVCCPKCGYRNETVQKSPVLVVPITGPGSFEDALARCFQSGLRCWLPRWLWAPQLAEAYNMRACLHA